MQFPYHILPGKPNPAFPNRVSIARPILAITLQNGDKKVTTAAIVDSGADNCIFPASLAAQLNITIPNRRAYTFPELRMRRKLRILRLSQQRFGIAIPAFCPLPLISMPGFAKALNM